MADDGSLRDMTALITGGAGGIGAAAARRVAALGAKVAVVDVDGDHAEAVAAEIRAQSGTAIARQLDVSDSTAVETVVADVAAALGPIRVLVNVAGFPDDYPVTEMSDEAFNNVIRVSLFGTFACIRAVVPGMVELKYGRIVNVSSRAYLGNPGQANYSAAKAGVIGLTRALALELGRHGVTVNAVAPGLIDTPAARAHPLFDDFFSRSITRSPLGRIGEPAEVADAIAWLASPGASFITGDVIHVSGGRFA